ncbi:MAG TPA: PHP domain-containing protein [Anaeromyxobacteraceae bacterium]|nr:PHP domain-containing protein [Anaeromyxobacteraceae bacterium]
MLIDLHVHSHHTRGCTLAPRDVLRRAKEVWLDGVAFTDLNTLDGLEEIRAASREVGLLALAGVEIATDRGHYLCFFPAPEEVPAPPQLFGSATPWPVREVLERVRELGGVAVAAHPYDKSIERPSGDFIFTLDGLSAVEGLNGRRKTSTNDLAVEAADHMSLPCVAGSDAHASLDEIGRAATLFRDVVKTEADVVAQIKAATVYAVAIGVEPGHAEREERRPPRDRQDRGGRSDRHGGGPRGPRRGPR